MEDLIESSCENTLYVKLLMWERNFIHVSLSFVWQLWEKKKNPAIIILIHVIILFNIYILQFNHHKFIIYLFIQHLKLKNRFTYLTIEYFNFYQPFITKIIFLIQKLLLNFIGVKYYFGAKMYFIFSLIEKEICTKQPKWKTRD